MSTQRTNRPADERISELAARQHGVVSRGQLRAAGVSDAQVTHRLRTGRLHGLHRGVFAVGHELTTREGRLMAATLACGEGAALSHQTAGDHWELRPTASGRIHLIVPSNAGRRAGNLTIHRSTALLASEVTVHRAIPVTTPARTLLDLAAVLRREQLERAVERAEALELFDMRAVEAVLAAHPRQPGRRELAGVLEAWAVPEFTRSDLEVYFLELCAAAGLPRPQVNVMVGPYEVDFLWPQERVIVETDGRDTHGTRQAFERDRARDARLLVAGYRVLRFSYRQVLREPAFVAGVVRDVLAARA